MPYIPKNKFTAERIKIVREIVRENFEQGNNSRSKRRIFREKIYKRFPMSYRTFVRYMSADLCEKKSLLPEIKTKNFSLFE